eukprot:TRINITY_DN6432_c0_g1_i2.p1 TRINITY_DN6432_c0_g1~~TRINITY_DN6432_c0_g1_i2.p1  ORF type:complete len:206 (+),score=36.55 TRINITY_DN6432_c0_g1_i2:48-665(+)
MESMSHGIKGSSALQEAQKQGVATRKTNVVQDTEEHDAFKPPEPFLGNVDPFSWTSRGENRACAAQSQGVTKVEALKKFQISSFAECANVCTSISDCDAIDYYEKGLLRWKDPVACDLFIGKGKFNTKTIAKDGHKCWWKDRKDGASTQEANAVQAVEENDAATHDTATVTLADIQKFTHPVFKVGGGQSLKQSIAMASKGVDTM